MNGPVLVPPKMSWERRAYLGIYDARNLIVNDEPLCCRLLAGILRRHTNQFISIFTFIV